jgi:hypothetical protein
MLRFAQLDDYAADRHPERQRRIPSDHRDGVTYEAKPKQSFRDRVALARRGLLRVALNDRYAQFSAARDAGKSAVATAAMPALARDQ